MSLQVQRLLPDDYEGWDRFVLNHPHGSPFHLTAWKKSIEETFGCRPYSLLVRDGREICGVLPLFLVKNPLTGKALISSPFAVYGGALAGSPEAAAALREEVSRLGRSLAVEYVELRNSHPEQCLGFAPVDRYVTFVQELGPDEEAILDAIPRKTRAAVRKSLRYPLALDIVGSPAIFIDLYLRSLHRLGTPAFPARHFSTLLRHFGAMADVRELRLEGKPVAAVLTFFFRDRVIPFYGASDPACNECQPNNYMYFDLMRWGRRNAFNVFDFGRSKKTGSGSFDFKAHWGMEMRDLPYEMLLVKRASLPNFSPNNPSFELAIRAWRKLPYGLTRRLGPFLIKLFP
jgi:FemAB-related protein (PEP-CTERM system-associated)